MVLRKQDSRPIRVLLIGPDLPIVGGQTVQALMIIERFRNDADVHVDMQPINPRFLPPMQRVKYLRTAVTSFKYLLDLITKVPRYDAVHIFSASYFSFILSPIPAGIISRIFRKKSILHYHSGEADDHFTRWKSAGPMTRIFDRIITPSNYLVDVFRKHKIDARSISNVVDMERFNYRTRSPISPVFLSSRSLEPLYNVECTVRAFSIIQSLIPDASLVIAGDGSQRAMLADLVKELELRNVEFLGMVQPDEMPSVYDRADVFLNTPNVDNMPNSIIEAFASGLAVVSTNAGGIPYIVDHERNGLLVEKGDHEGIAQQALRLLSDPELARRITEEALRDCENYRWRSVRQQWVGLYEELTMRTRYQAVAADERTSVTS
ncbi:MAG: glycosyltransferase family 4 protein [Pyrinomonadaceae bacterium]